MTIILMLKKQKQFSYYGKKNPPALFKWIYPTLSFLMLPAKELSPTILT